MQWHAGCRGLHTEPLKVPFVARQRSSRNVFISCTRRSARLDHTQAGATRSLGWGATNVGRGWDLCPILCHTQSAIPRLQVFSRSTLPLPRACGTPVCTRPSRVRAQAQGLEKVGWGQTTTTHTRTRTHSA